MTNIWWWNRGNGQLNQVANTMNSLEAELRRQTMQLPPPRRSSHVHTSIIMAVFAAIGLGIYFYPNEAVIAAIVLGAGIGTTACYSAIYHTLEALRK